MKMNAAKLSLIQDHSANQNGNHTASSNQSRPRGDWPWNPNAAPRNVHRTRGSACPGQTNKPKSHYLKKAGLEELKWG